VVIDGCVRDRDLLDHIGFPVFARGLCIMGTGKDAHARGSLGTPIVIGEVEIHTGDLVVGDADGVVAVRHDHITQTLDKAEERERKEAAMVEALKGGATTLDLMSLR
jgi:4-hydroxy-4-methyl-2-oxoglutarate aldolase